MQNTLKYKLPFPNYLRTKNERRVRECFLRQSGFQRSITHRVVNWRDSRIIMFLENNGEFKC
jgi:hypothetical protein